MEDGGEHCIEPNLFYGVNYMFQLMQLEVVLTAYLVD